MRPGLRCSLLPRLDKLAHTCCSFMASEIFGTAALFWVLIPLGLAGGALLLKLQGDRTRRALLSLSSPSL